VADPVLSEVELAVDAVVEDEDGDGGMEDGSSEDDSDAIWDAPPFANVRLESSTASRVV